MRTRDMIRAAKRDGQRAGKAAASWCFDGNTSLDTYREFLRGWEEGDPKVLDRFNAPNLSGEWAGDPTPQTLANEYGLTPENDPDGERLATVCEWWEHGAGSAFWAELERVARLHLGK